MSDYFKYHGLGNDYLVLEPRRFQQPPSEEAIRRICDRHRGIGSDGILWGPMAEPLPESAPRGDPPEAVPLRIYNPDGSEAEKSGNGLRIFARHIWGRGLVEGDRFALATAGGVARAAILDSRGSRIEMEMGVVRFDSESIPMGGPPREVLGETLHVGERAFEISAANVGNPHCVVIAQGATEEFVRQYGPAIERHELFPNRTNVQFLTVQDEHRIRIGIWERGAGYTAASGSSSCAAAAVACRLGLCRSPVTVEMDGGELSVTLDAGFHATLAGPVEAVGEGDFAPEFLAVLGLVRARE